MAGNRIGTRIETLIRKREWKQAQTIIEKQLGREPEDHWLWARLSGVKYEQRNYQGALQAAEKALQIVPDCPLAQWSYASAAELLGDTEKAMMSYANLFQRGLQQLQNPDADANECWEGPDWTSGLAVDCVFRTAGCLAKIGRQDKAVGTYGTFLSLVDLGMQGIYSHEDALKKLHKLVPNKKSATGGSGEKHREDGLDFVAVEPLGRQLVSAGKVQRNWRSPFPQCSPLRPKIVCDPSERGLRTRAYLLPVQLPAMPTASAQRCRRRCRPGK